jgi:hypothetical protein
VGEGLGVRCCGCVAIGFGAKMSLIIETSCL